MPPRFYGAPRAVSSRVTDQMEDAKCNFSIEPCEDVTWPGTRGSLHIIIDTVQYSAKSRFPVGPILSADKSVSVWSITLQIVKDPQKTCVSCGEAD